jgi:hypothetical protein
MHSSCACYDTNFQVAPPPAYQLVVDSNLMPAGVVRAAPLTKAETPVAAAIPGTRLISR